MRRLAGGVVAAVVIAAGAAPGAHARDEVRPVDLTTERMDAPLGLGERAPRLAWKLRADGRGREQSAYRVVVRTEHGHDVWDSGVVRSDASAGIRYDGEPLRSRTEYEWRVKVWDERGRDSDWSREAEFETGLLEASDWSARWIEGTTQALGLGGARWIWFPEGDPTSGAPAATRFLRTTFDLPAGAEVRTARMLLTADDEFELYVNGQRLADTHDLRDRDVNAWQRGQLVDAAGALRPGANAIAVAVANRNHDNGSQSPAGFIGRLRIELAGGDPVTVDTGAAWKASDAAPAGWEQPGFDDSAWPQAMELATYGSGPWGSNVSAPSLPPPYLRRDFAIDGRVAQARLYATALGVYEARINGERVGDLELAPGWTDYRRKVQYQAYDVTRLLRRGGNALGAVVADGWFSGRLQGGQRYGDRPAFLAQLEVRYTDGRTERIVTDGSWSAGEGGLRAAGLYDGEVFDARAEPRGWDAAGFDGDWAPAVERDEDGPALVATTEPGMRVVDEVRPVGMTEPEPGTYIYDLGQNMVGWVRMRAQAPAGATIRVRHGEVLNPDGSLYTANLRSAQATEEITSAGGRTTYEPRFTYHGFRYVEVTGADEPPQITGRVVSADTPRTGEFETSNAMLDGLQHAIEWGQWGNFLAVPTDCPQRDERLGWTGDIQMFAETSTFNADVRNYLGKWLGDLDEAQRPDGAYPDVAPAVCCGAGTAGWGDAGTIVPWALYERYGDAEVLAEHYEPMTRWIEYLRTHSTGLLRPNEGYGDWVGVEDTPRDVIGTAFFARSTEIVADAAEVLGHTADAERYRALWRDVRDAFVAAYVTPDGRVKGDSQTAYVLPLRFGLLEGAQREGAQQRLVELIEARGWHLSTGFLGTPHLLQVLTDAGRTDVAYRLLEQDTYPSWGYMVRNGATTVWERWDSLRPDGTFQDPGMNSFNHYGFGAVGDWMYRNVAGLEPDPEAPGWRRAIVRPRLGGTLTHASAEHDTSYGRFESAWRLRGGRLELDATVPPNTRATVHVPAESVSEVRESGRPAWRAPGVRFLRMEQGAAVFAVGSGSYEFTTGR